MILTRYFFVLCCSLVALNKLLSTFVAICVLYLFLTVPWIGMMSVIVAVPGYTHFRCEDPFNVHARIQRGGGRGSGPHLKIHKK